MSSNQLEFFDRLYRYCDGLVEIRPLPGEQGFFQYKDMDPIRESCSRWPSANIYFGVGTRNGGGGKKENLLQIPAVWCDCDFK